MQPPDVLCVWVLFLALLTGFGPVGATPVSDAAPRAETLVERYNERDLGAPGWRRVHLDLRQGQRSTRSFTVVNAWRRDGGGTRTLFLLEQPESLAGTSYLLVEQPRLRSGDEVYLFLPAGQRRVLTIEPGRFDEGLLGSDFSYRDLRLQLPVEGYRFRYVGERQVEGRRAHAVDAEPAGPAVAETSAWGRVRYYFDPESPMLLGADYFAPDARRPGKRLRVEEIHRVDGAWTETRMVMRAEDGRSSVLTLQDFHPGVADLEEMAPELFGPEALPSVADRLGELLHFPRSSVEAPTDRQGGRR